MAKNYKNNKRLEKQVILSAEMTAKNAIEQAMISSDWSYFDFNQSLSAKNGYNNITLDLLTRQQILLTYLYKTFGILGKVVDIPVDDAYKYNGIELNADSIDEEELKRLQDSLVDNFDIENLKIARKWARLFGGAALIVNDGTDLKTPLNYKSLKDKYVEFIPVDRWQLQYTESNINIRGGRWSVVNYGKLKNSTSVHDSRVIILNGKRAPYLIMQQVQGWGISVYEQIFQDMNQFFKARNVMFELLDEAKTDVLKLASMQAALSSSGGKQALQMMVDTIAANKNYKSQITLSKDDDYEQKQISFSGFDGILKEIRIMMAGSANMPVNKLWGESVTGFGSGEDSLENYNSQIENEVRTPDYPIIKELIKIRCYQLFGREVKDIAFTWKNLRVLSAIDEQNINDKKIANVLQLFDRQLLTPQELMEYLKKQQLFIHDTKALNGELEEMELQKEDSDKTGFKDIVK